MTLPMSPDSTPAAASGDGSPSPSPAAPIPTLEDLLRVPEDVGRVDPVTGQPSTKPPPAGNDEDPPSPIQLEFDRSEDESAVRPSTSRSRTDAGVAVDVVDGVKLRGGVRIEEETGREAEEPIPRVGIEKRF